MPVRSSASKLDSRLFIASYRLRVCRPVDCFGVPSDPLEACLLVLLSLPCQFQSDLRGASLVRWRLRRPIYALSSLCLCFGLAAHGKVFSGGYPQHLDHVATSLKSIKPRSPTQATSSKCHSLLNTFISSLDNLCHPFLVVPVNHLIYVLVR